MASKLSGIELTRYDDLFKTDAERKADRQERIQIVPAAEIFPYSRQPYTIDRPTPDLARLMDSIEHIGIAEPLIVRPRESGGYEIISGHRRDYCAKAVGLDTRPILVRNYSDEEADILVVDYNINREDLLPSEKAKAYKLKLDAMKRQGQRTDLTSGQLGQKLKGHSSIDLLADQVDESRKQVQRYVRLNKLIPPLLDAVDAGTLKFVPAADFLSHLSEKEQTYLLLVMERDEVSPSLGQAQRLKQLSGEGKLENNIIDLIMREEKPLERKVTIRNDRLQKYFPSSYTPKQMEDVIIKLLEGWHRTLAGVTHADKKEAGAALLTMCQTMLSPEATQVGSYRGLTLELAFDTFAREYRLTMIGQLRHTVTLGTDVFGNLQRMDNALEGLPIKEQACREQFSNLQTQLETAKAEVQKPFSREAELNTKTARLEELNSLLNLDHKEPEIVDAEPDEDQRPPERRRPQLER